jgi:putative peptidoglycan lipid II flippase
MLTLVSKAIAHCRRLGSGTVNQRIASATIIIMAGTVLVKIAAAIKDIVIAGHFGLGDDLDALLIALVMPSFVTGVIAYSLNGAFVPAYVRVREREGIVAAKRLFGNVMLLSVALLLACTLLLASAAGPLLKLLAWQFTSEKLALTESLYLLLLPVVVVGGQITLWGAVLNADEKFALAALAPILSPLIIMAALVSFVPGLTIGGLAWSIVIGSVAELAVLGVALARKGLLPVPRWWGETNDTREVLRQYVPAVAATIVMSSTTVIDNAMASWLGSGAVAALAYGNKIPAFLAAAGMTALGSAVLPHFSRLVATRDHAAIRHTLSTYSRWLLILAIPVTLVFMAASEWLVRVLFERGAFGADDTAQVTLIQQMYLIQIPFVMVGILGGRLLIAMSKMYLLSIMAVINLAVVVVGNLVLMRWLGVSGIALATSIMYIVSTAMIWVLVNRSLGAAIAGVRDPA